MPIQTSKLKNHQTSATNCSLTISVQTLQTLAKTGSKDIGRKSVSTARAQGGFILGTGTTSAHFHIFGKYSCLRDELNTAAMGSLKNGPHSFSNHVGNPSGTGDL